MKVTLLNYTTDALELLLFTKQTRLTMGAGQLEEVKAWPLERKMKELDYMRGTIKSSWEFVDYVFDIEGVSRAFTHQFVRTRTGSYAQQSQRTVDMEGFEYITPEAILATGGEVKYSHDDAMFVIAKEYKNLRELGVLPQDARAVLPTNVSTNIIAKFNLRTMHETGKLRLCTRTQGEYQRVFRAMRDEVIKVHPWAEPFIQVACVTDGVCQFPNYMECPIKGPIFNPETGRRWDEEHLPIATRADIKLSWDQVFFEAVPQQGERT
jgi:flavin-dependent thymidylate synthase